MERCKSLLRPQHAVLLDMTNRLSNSGVTPFHPPFEDLARKTLARWRVPGVAIAVIDGSQTFTKGYGIARYPDTSVTPETLFYTDSTTKAFTAAAVAILIEDESHPTDDWTTPISSIIEEDFVLIDDFWTDRITIEDALCHRSGFPAHDMVFDGNNSAPRDVVRSLRYLPLTRLPGTAFQYCNVMYVGVGHVVKTITGKWLRVFFNERIWGPLGMHSTFLTLTDALQSGILLAQGFHWTEEKGFEHVQWPVIPECKDYALWINTDG